MNKVSNILLVGLGGQGVNALYHVLQSTILKAGLHCKGAIFKGGAQKRGTVYAMIRIFDDVSTALHFSPIIPDKSLDLLIAFEANEALRYSHLYQKSTTMLVNDFTVPFYKERFAHQTKMKNPLREIKTHFTNTKILDVNAESKLNFNHLKMVNVLMGIHAMKTDLLPIDVMDYLDAFQQKVSIQYEDMIILLETVKK